MKIDQQKLEEAYKKVVVKEDIGIDTREGYPEKFGTDVDETLEEPEMDVFKKSLNEIKELLGDSVDLNILADINQILKNLYTHAFSEGQKIGKETWKN